MPQRIIKPALTHMRSPVTAKAVMLFLAVVFIVYTVITDQQQRIQSFERYRAIQEYTEQSHTALEAVKRNNEAFEQSMQNTSAMLMFMDQMSKSMHEVAEILKINRETTRLEHQQLQQSLDPVKKKIQQKVIPQKECYELRSVDKKIGNNIVHTQQYVKIRCR